MTARNEFEGWRHLSAGERLGQLSKRFDLSVEDLEELSRKQPPIELAEALVENAIGYVSVPLGVALNFEIDGRARWIPMAIEESSVIASASAAAKWLRSRGGKIETHLDSCEVMTQVQIPRPVDAANCQAKIEAHQEALLATANESVPGLVRRGGGFKALRTRALPRPDGNGSMVILDLFCDPCDAMGANLVTQAAERLKPLLRTITGDQPTVAILSNWTDRRIARAEVQIPGVGDLEAEGIQEASFFAESDPYRAVTHNKGIMNGIDAVLVATGNDWRAVDAAAHAHASRTGVYRPLSRWRWHRGEGLSGTIELPIAAGTVGGVTGLHPAARTCLKILGAKSSKDLSRVCAAVGLIQNLAALRALSGPGLSAGHMKLHAANLARMVGAHASEQATLTDQLRKRLEVQGHITQTDAFEILQEMRGDQ